MGFVFSFLFRSWIFPSLSINRLNPSLMEMTDRELANRRKARGLRLRESLEREDRATEEQYQCNICKSFCYLSAVTCTCNPNIVVCVDHVSSLCKCSMDHRSLRLRFSDNELMETQEKVQERAQIPDQWKAKLSRLLLENARPHLKALKALLAEGDKIQYDGMKGLEDLRRCVVKAGEWVQMANEILVRKPNRKRAAKRKAPGDNAPTSSSAGSDGYGGFDVADRPDKSLEDLYELLRQVDDLGFDCPEIGMLRTLAGQAEEVRGKAKALLAETSDFLRSGESIASDGNQRPSFVADCEKLLLDASSLNVSLDELIDVEKMVAREQLIKELEANVDDTSVMTLEEVSGYLSRARICGLSSENRHIKDLEARQRAGQTWDERARHVLSQPFKTIEELDEFNDIDATIPIDPAVLSKIANAREKAKDYERQATTWLNPEMGVMKPKVQDVMRLVTRAEKDFNIPAVKELKRMADLAGDCENKCDELLRDRFEHAEDDDVFEIIDKFVNYAKQHLTALFAMPKFETIDEQLTQHYRWLETMPWKKTPIDVDLLMKDIMDNTRPEEDLPPEDEFFTCICLDAVRPPEQGQVSDAVQCDHCSARFHAACAKSGGSCPFCDHSHWNGTIRKERSFQFAVLPVILNEAPVITRFYSPEWKQLEIMVHRISRLSTVIAQFLSFSSPDANQKRDYIGQVRHYMRKLYKLQFNISPREDLTFGLDLAGLHRIIASQPTPMQSRTKKRRRPKFMFGQDVDADWLDKTRCICRGRTPYLLNYPTVTCESCSKMYHGGCVFFPVDHTIYSNRFICPLCCLRKNRRYEYAELRVKDIR